MSCTLIISRELQHYFARHAGGDDGGSERLSVCDLGAGAPPPCAPSRFLFLKTERRRWVFCFYFLLFRGGHLAVLQWARANGCAWDAWTCSKAAFKRHPAVLQWARANGCPEHEDVGAEYDSDGDDRWGG